MCSLTRCVQSLGIYKAVKLASINFGNGLYRDAMLCQSWITILYTCNVEGITNVSPSERMLVHITL